MRATPLRQHRDLPRYLWERSCSRTVRLPRRFHVTDDALATISAWVQQPHRNPALSVCIPTKEALDLLVPCLESLALTCGGRPVEVIIGDTGSSQETLGLYSRLGLRVVSAPAPFSFSRTCNQMANASQAPALLFLNDDTSARTPDWFDRLLTSEDAIVGAALVYPGTERVQHAGVEVVALDGLRPNAYPPHRERGDFPLGLANRAIGKRLETITCGRAPVMAVTGAFLHTSRARFEALGGFDEAYGVDLQDIDYCLRARASGVEVICRRDIVFTHQHAASRGRYRFPHEDWQLFVSRWGDDLRRWSDYSRYNGKTRDIAT